MAILMIAVFAAALGLLCVLLIVLLIRENIRKEKNREAKRYMEIMKRVVEEGPILKRTKKVFNRTAFGKTIKGRGIKGKIKLRKVIK